MRKSKSRDRSGGNKVIDDKLGRQITAWQPDASTSGDRGGENKMIDKLGGQIRAWQQMQAHLANDLGLQGSYYVGNCCLCVSIALLSLQPSSWL